MKFWHTPECQKYKSETGCKFGRTWLFRDVEAEEKPSKKSKKGVAKGTWHQVKIRKRKGPSQGIIQKCAPHERSLCASKFGEKSHGETLQERCARRDAWDLATKIYQLKNADKATFYTSVEARAMPAPTSKSPGEREFAVDSGACK